MNNFQCQTWLHGQVRAVAGQSYMDFYVQITKCEVVSYVFEVQHGQKD